MLRNRWVGLFVWELHDDLHAGPVHGLFAEFDGPDDGHGLVAAAGRAAESPAP